MKKTIILFFVFLFLPTFIFSQSDSVKTVFNEIVVSATKSETPYYAIGNSVSVITSETIQQKQLKTIIDVLQEVPGLSISQLGGPGKQTSVFLRGTNSNHTLVILDGVKLNDPSSPSNAFDFSSLNVFDISRIEVVKNSQSTLYGSDAIGGVINIITKSGASKPQYKFEGEVGSNNYYRSNLSAIGSYENLNYGIFLSRASSDGISAANSIYGNYEKDGFSNTSFSSNINYVLNKNWKVGFIYKFLNSKTDLDQNEKLGDDPNYNYKLEEHLTKLSLSSLLFDGKWKQEISSSFIRRFANAIDLPDNFHKNISSDSYNNGSRFKFDWQNNLYVIPQNIITFGIESEKETANSSYISNSDWGPFESKFPKESQSVISFYLQDQFELNNSFFITAGYRYDSYKQFGNVNTFRVSPVYFMKETNTKFRFSFGNGFKAPSLYYLFDPFFGNPELKPEKSKSWDAGIEQVFNSNFSLSATYFSIDINDMIGYDNNFKAVNISKVKTNGIEFATSAKFDNIIINANYTYTKSIDNYELSPEFKEELLRRPKNQLYFFINYIPHQKIDFGLSLKHVGSRIDKDFSVYPSKRVTLPNYTLLNLYVNYKLFDYLSLNSRIENLFNKKYEDVLYYGTLGRSFYFGLMLNI